MANKRTVVLGASNKPERYSNQAVRMLTKHGHDVVPVHPLHSSIEGISAAKNLTAVAGPVHTVTMYVNAGQSDGLADEITGLSPERVVFNPGSENPRLERALEAAGVEVVHGCTLVMLRTGQY